MQESQEEGFKYSSIEPDSSSNHYRIFPKYFSESAHVFTFSGKMTHATHQNSKTIALLLGDGLSFILNPISRFWTIIP